MPPVRLQVLWNRTSALHRGTAERQLQSNPSEKETFLNGQDAHFLSVWRLAVAHTFHHGTPTDFCTDFHIIQLSVKPAIGGNFVPEAYLALGDAPFLLAIFSTNRRLRFPVPHAFSLPARCPVRMLPSPLPPIWRHLGEAKRDGRTGALRDESEPRRLKRKRARNNGKHRKQYGSGTTKRAPNGTAYGCSGLKETPPPPWVRTAPRSKRFLPSKNFSLLHTRSSAGDHGVLAREGGRQETARIPLPTELQCCYGREIKRGRTSAQQLSA